MLESDFSNRLVFCDVNPAAGHVEPGVCFSSLNLEYLTLQRCLGLGRLLNDDSLRRLKALVVSLCEGVKGIELSATQISSFYYKGDNIQLSSESVPNLEEVHVTMKEVNVIPTFARLEKQLPSSCQDY
ncbi:hypothetical protein FF2_025816 [Malus domestica]